MLNRKENMSKYKFRIDSVSMYSTARPQSFCMTQEQAERLALEHQAHLPGCKTTISEIGRCPGCGCIEVIPAGLSACKDCSKPIPESDERIELPTI